jgi:hypothetical protein
MAPETLLSNRGRNAHVAHDQVKSLYSSCADHSQTARALNGWENNRPWPSRSCAKDFDGSKGDRVNAEPKPEETLQLERIVT